MAKTMQWFLDKYGESHQNATNKLIHWVCVPSIMFSLPFRVDFCHPFSFCRERIIYQLGSSIAFAGTGLLSASVFCNVSRLFGYWWTNALGQSCDL